MANTDEERKVDPNETIKRAIQFLEILRISKTPQQFKANLEKVEK